MGGASAGTMTKPRPARGFVVFKWLVYALLAADVVLYGLHGRPTELIDTAAWFLLLMLFEWETGGWRLPSARRPLLHGLRLLACIAVAVACVGYALERAWLDFANEMTWLGVIALLELEVRLPPTAVRLHRVRRAAALVLYGLLGGYMVTWAIAGLGSADPGAGALDAWDALLWLVAFLVIELNVVRVARDDRR